MRSPILPFSLWVLLASGCGSSNENPGCTDGQKTCIEAATAICKAGQWSIGTNCADNADDNRSCLDGKCVCSDGRSKCQGSVVQTCQAGVWSSGEDCATSGEDCLEGQCVAKACSDGQKRCNADMVEICEASSWAPMVDCARAGQVCIGAACVTPCTEGETKCAEEVVQTCENKVWVFGEDCAASDKECVNGACVALGCTNGTNRCNGDVAQACIGDTWTDSEDCALSSKKCVNGACVIQACTDGASRCDSNTVQTCQAGNWVNGEDCTVSNRQCANGACVCTEGEAQCRGAVVQTCTAGNWVDGEDCAATGGVCRNGACSNGSFPDDPGATGPCTFTEFSTTSESVSVTVLIPAGLPEPYPAVVISHGFILDSELYASTAEHLASWCYIAVLSGSKNGANHQKYSDDTKKIVTWLKAKSDPNLQGKVDAAHIALLGHSLGGKVSLLTAVSNPGMVQAVIGFDPVDATRLQPIISVTPELVPNLDVPTLLLGERWDGENAGMNDPSTPGLDYCAPLADNYQQYYEYIPPNLPTLEVSFGIAGHMSWLDNPSCGVACSACAVNPNANPDRVKSLSRRYATAWLERFLRGRVDVERWLWGTEMDADVATGDVSYRRK